MKKCKSKIRKGDKVIITSGKDKGRIANVTAVVFDDARNDYWCKVEGANMQTHFVKANPQNNEPGGKVLREGLIHISNIALVDSENKASKIGMKLAEDGEKVRFLKTTGETVVAVG